jgi:hypothetical protein
MARRGALQWRQPARMAAVVGDASRERGNWASTWRRRRKFAQISRNAISWWQTVISMVVSEATMFRWYFPDLIIFRCYGNGPRHPPPSRGRRRRAQGMKPCLVRRGTPCTLPASRQRRARNFPAAVTFLFSLFLLLRLPSSRMHNATRHSREIGLVLPLNLAFF